MKPIVWIGDSLDDLKAFPDSARQSAGHQLSKIQHGELPDDWKPMGTIGVGVCEIRVRMPQARFASSMSHASVARFMCCTRSRKSPGRRRGKTSISRASAFDRYEVMHEQDYLREEE